MRRGRWEDFGVRFYVCFRGVMYVECVPAIFYVRGVRSCNRKNQKIIERDRPYTSRSIGPVASSANPEMSCPMMLRGASRRTMTSLCAHNAREAEGPNRGVGCRAAQRKKSRGGHAAAAHALDNSYAVA